MAGYGSRYGKMNLDDFLDLMEGQIRANASDRNLEELKKACSLIGDESAAEALMEDADHNKDHKLDFDEWVEMLKDFDI